MAVNSVKVSLGERSYEIVIGAGVLRDLGVRLRGLGFLGRIGLVTDTRVGKLYAARTVRTLKAAGFQPHVFVVPSGERAKTLAWTARLLDKLVALRFERRSVVVALGGGVVGDLAGFVAAVYLRGLPFVQVPTTLIAQVDSSVGGKTGVNHRKGKNLIGAFYQPRLVLADTETLATLPAREWRAGLAEVIKYGMIADANLFAYLESRMGAVRGMEPKSVAHIVARSCQIKADVVMEDERESDRRRVLNYGHTIGHALETLGSYRTLVHGEAVAIGMVHEADLARHLGLCSSELVNRQRALVLAAGLPATLASVRGGAIWDAMQHDKKVAAGQVYCVLPRRVGDVCIRPVERTEFADWFAARAGAKATGGGR